MAMLEVRDLRKSFYTYAKPGLQAGIFHKPGARKVVSQLDVLKGVDLTVNKGDVVAILGPSGSGKTTFLRCLNFLETADSGTLIFDGEQFDLGKITKEDAGKSRPGRPSRFLPPPALRRPAAAGGHCPCSCHRPGNSLF